MMKRITLFFLLFCVMASKSLADEQKDITLSNDHNEETITLQSLCNIFVTLKVNDEESGKLSLYIENIGEENPLLLFGADFNEKYLKRLSPKITYHKIFGGSKGRRTTDYSRDLDGIKKIDPSDKKILVTKEVSNGGQNTIRVPIYIAKYKNKKRNAIELLEKQVVELNIRVELKPDEEFIRLSSEISDYLKKIESKPFCKHRRHRATLEQQRDYYKRVRESMTERIDSILRAHTSWFKGDRGYEKYDSLRVALQNIDLESQEYETANCGRTSLHKSGPRLKTGHSCKYCNLSLVQIYHKLDDCYQKIYNDRKKKNSLINEVRTLYNCCSDDDCRKHSSEWKKGGFYKNKIVERYNKINGL